MTTTEPITTEPIRIVIADDHPLFRDGLRTLLQSDSRFAVVGEAGDALTAVDATRSHQPDVLLLDLAMPEASGLETLRQLAANRHRPGGVGIGQRSQGGR